MTSIHEQYKKKGGRPPTGRVRKLSKSVTVKFSKPSYEALRQRARKANRKLAEYIRESALNGEVVSGHNAETVNPHRYGKQPQPTYQAVASERFPGNPCVCGGLVEEIENRPCRVSARKFQT